MAPPLADHGVAGDMYLGFGHPGMASDIIRKTADRGREDSGDEPQGLH